MTDKLYDTDSYIKEFEAEVCSVTKTDKGYEAVLSATAFFPEGGGQYGDTGTLNGKKVKDTRTRDGQIIHYMDEPIAEGETARGVLNWEKRFDCMQQHSGEHIISGIVKERFGYNNVGFHLARDYCTLDFDGVLSDDDIEAVEAAANRAVVGNIEVQVLFPDKMELESMDYRSKIEIDGQVRIVEIPGVDRCACCAPHVARTGEIGMIRIVHAMNYKGGIRLTMKSGFRALADYRKKSSSVNKISVLLCAKEDEVAEGVERLMEEAGERKEENNNIRRVLLRYKAKDVDVSQKYVCYFDDSLKGDDPRELMNLLLERGVKIAVIFACTGDDSFRYVAGSRSCDTRKIGEVIKKELGGKGGGKPEMIQGSVSGNRAVISEKIICEMKGLLGNAKE